MFQTPFKAEKPKKIRKLSRMQLSQFIANERRLHPKMDAQAFKNKVLKTIQSNLGCNPFSPEMEYYSKQLEKLL